ncbi:MAG: RrF2 family transcriptional regulator [Fidelibacterota bacterium]
MSVLFSKACQYAIQSVIYLAAQQPDTPILQRDIAEALDIPNHFLGKILQQLARHGIVVSQKGKAGGFLLSQPPEEISLLRVAKIVDGESFLDYCVVGFPGCQDENPCPLHPLWSSAKKIIIQMLRDTPVTELSDEIQTKLDYIASMHTGELDVDSDSGG